MEVVYHGNNPCDSAFADRRPCLSSGQDEINVLSRRFPPSLNARRFSTFSRVYLKKEEATARADFSSVQGGKSKV